MLSPRSRAALLASLVVMSTSAANAADLFASASVGTRAASALFHVSGTDLIVTLTNTTPNDVLVPVDLLTAVFWDSSVTLTLGRTSGVLAGGSAVVFGPAPAGGIIGGEYAYKGALAGAPHGAKYGISSAGFGLFGPGDLFPGPDLEPPASPDGMNYGLLSAGDNPATGNPAVTGGNPLIKNAVVLTLSGLPAGFDPSTMISNVSFQYGTGLEEPNIPEPGTALLLVVGAVAMACRPRRTRGL